MKQLFQKHAPMGIVFILVLAVVIETGLLISGYLYYQSLVEIYEQTPIKATKIHSSATPITMNLETPPNSIGKTTPSISDTKAEELVFVYDSLTKKTETQAYKIMGGYKLFTKEEVEEIKTNLVEPYFDYYNEEENHIALVIIITKPGYSFKAIYNNGGTHELYRANSYQNKLYWVPPDCMGPCKISATYKQKHPKTVALYTCLNPTPPEVYTEPNKCMDKFFEN